MTFMNLSYLLVLLIFLLVRLSLLISLDRLYLICQYPIGNYIHYRRLQWLYNDIRNKRESFNLEAQRMLQTLTTGIIYACYSCDYL